MVTVEKTVTVDKNITDNGTLRSGLTWTNAGISVIDLVAVTLNVSSPFTSNPADLSDLSASLRHGNGAESYRLGSLFAAGDMTSLSQTFTQGISFDGNYLSSGYWNLAVSDGQGGGIARLDSWKLAVTGTPLASGTLDLGAGAVLTAASTGTTEVGAAVVSNGTGASAITLATDSNKNLNLSGGLSGSGNFSKTGEGTVRIGNSSGFSGRLDIAGGTTVIAGGLGSGSAVRVGAGGKLGGTGTVGALEIASGGTLAVGNSPGTLTAQSAVWNGGGRYQVEISGFPLSLQEGATGSNFLGGAGTNWDYFNVSTTLTINASSGNKFIIDVASLLADNSSGNASGFLPQYDYSLAIATAAGGISGFDSSYFGFDLSKFTNSRDYAPWMSHGGYAPGSFNVSLSGDSKTLYLNYARAIPEPNSAALGLGALGALLLRRRRKRWPH